jgi:predicted dehydrogenase
MTTQLSRRDFVASTAAFALATPFSRAVGANDALRVGIIGLGGKGNQHYKKLFGKDERVRIVGRCDADAARIGGKDKAKGQHIDMREMLDRDDIDAVVIATCNHWHSLAAIWACQAGKHVYVEKPISHNVFEGRKVVEAARKYNRIVQVGTQKRSHKGWQELRQAIDKGTFGKVKVVRGFCIKRRKSIGKVSGAQEPPATVDYNLYQGPAPLAPLKRGRFHYDWHWQWATGNGDIGNQGIHEVDICRWMAGHDRAPDRVISYGGRFAYDDDGETPNTQSTVLDFGTGNAPIVFEVRGLPAEITKSGEIMPHYKGQRVGVVVEFEDGGWSDGNRVYDKGGEKVHTLAHGGSERHTHNFVDAVLAGKRDVLTAESQEGHISAILFHLANISHRLGANASKGQWEDLAKASDLRGEIADRFLKAALVHEKDFSARSAVLGMDLRFDPKTERFVGAGADKANPMLTRAYREPFVVKDKV